MTQDNLKHTTRKREPVKARLGALDERDNQANEMEVGYEDLILVVMHLPGGRNAAGILASSSMAERRGVQNHEDQGLIPGGLPGS